MKNTENEKYVNRDISWLEFNARVLEEAADRGNPLLERLKFLAIFSGNLDEFCMVRMAGIAREAELNYTGTYDPAELIRTLSGRARKLVEKQYAHLHRVILPSLEKEGIRLLAWKDLSAKQQENFRKLFISQYLPVLTPVGIDSSHPFPQIPNLGLELLIRLKRESEKKELFAMLEVPQAIPRFLTVESSGEKISFLTAEELIENNLDLVFHKCDILECAAFRVTRDMDFSIDDDSTGDLLSEIQNALQTRGKRKVVRLEISSLMSRKSGNCLCTHLSVPEEEVFSIRGLLNLKDLFKLIPLIRRPDLCDEELPPLASVRIDKNLSMFENIARSEGGFLIHHPYESFDPVIRFLQEAADDPDVLAIKQTLYRVSGNSPVVKALIRAARNGKQVTVLFELKARFDEENNINWARELADAGAHVVYGIAGLKVHCKVLLVVRREDGGIRRYMHLGTGNYNDKTAKLYTDIGFFTDRSEFANDVSALFNVITGFSSPPEWNKLLVAPFSIREKLLYFIDREAALSTVQNPGSITIKVNALIDSEIIDHLYAAARKNVRIDLIVRGICGINPWFLPKQYAKNIRVVSILDRFLEHSRIYRFGNNGEPCYYVGSADVMERNIRRRIEVLFPVEKEQLRKELDFLLACAIHDRRKGRKLVACNKYAHIMPAPGTEPSRSQTKLYKAFRERLQRKIAENGREKPLVVYTSPQEEP